MGQWQDSLKMARRHAALLPRWSWFAAGAGLALLILLAMLPFLIPTEVYRHQIEAAVTRATGYNLEIGGPLRVVLLPSLGLSAHDVRLSNPAQPGMPALATIKSLDIGAALVPLLSGNLEISHITVDGAEIVLAANSGGRGNWMLPHRERADTSASHKLQFDGIHVSNSTLIYANGRAGPPTSLSEIDADVKITSLDQPITLDGSAIYLGKPVKFSATLNRPSALTGEQRTGVKLQAGNDLFSLSFAGTVASAGMLDGIFRFKSRSFHDFASWIGRKLPGKDGFGTAEVSSRIARRTGHVALKNLHVDMDGAVLEGLLNLDTSNDVPAIDGTLNATHLFLDRYTDTSAKTPHTGWSTEPIDLSALRLLNAQLAIHARDMRIRQLQLQEADVRVTLLSGALAVEMNRLAMYGGTASGTLNVNNRGPEAAFANSLKASGLALRPFLHDALGLGRYDGTAQLSFDFTAAGNSAREIMQSLNGRGAVALRNGHIHGVDLGLLARMIQTATTMKAAGKDTAFSYMGGTFTLAGGVATNRDFRLQSALANFSGGGRIDLGRQTIDFIFEPKLLSVGGKKGGKGIIDLGVPFRATGPWSDVRYTPDLGGLAKDIIGSTVRSVGAAAGAVTDAIGSVLPGNSNATPKKNTKKTKRKSALDSLGSIFH